MNTSVTSTPRRRLTLVLVLLASILALISLPAQPAAANYTFTIYVKLDVPAGWTVDYEGGEGTCLGFPPKTSKLVAKRNEYLSVVIDVQNEGDCFTSWSKGGIGIAVRDANHSEGNSPYSANFVLRQYGPHYFDVACDWRSNVRCNGDSGIWSATVWINPNGV